MAQRLAGDQLVVGRGGERGAIAGAGPVERAGGGGGARLGIEAERRARLDPRLGGAAAAPKSATPAREQAYMFG